MKPPFQRNPVWVDRQKSFLIDTVLNGYPIPEIYLQESVTAEGKARYIVVDGQQRLRAVLEFIEGKFSIDQKDTPQWGDMCFDDLTPEDKQKIYQYNFVVRTLPEMDGTQLRSIFQRLNRNVLALNKQELRQATYWGTFINLMNDLSNKPIWSELEVFTPNDVRRMLDVEYISELAIAVLNGIQNKKAKLDSYYEIYESDFDSDDSASLEKVFSRVLGEINNIFPTFSKTRWKKKTDFYSLFLVFSENVDSLPLSRDGRTEALTILSEFESGINEYVKTKDGNTEELPEPIRTYGQGIRASTDLGSRKRRHEGLATVLAEVWQR
ncbi:MAG: DUF262 domain-containing protein [Candidatus Thiodiazotropha endolucinida]